MCSSSITSFHFAWELQTGKLSHCGLRRGVLTHGSSSDQKKEEGKKETFVCFRLSHFWGKHHSHHGVVDPREKLRYTPCKATVETLPCCECTNITRPHTRSQCAICFLQCHHRLLHRDCLILSFLYSSERFSFSFFLYWDKLDTFIFVCIWLPT